MLKLWIVTNRQQVADERNTLRVWNKRKRNVPAGSQAKSSDYGTTMQNYGERTTPLKRNSMA